MAEETDECSWRDRFGLFGGRYVSEALWTPFAEVESAFREALDDEEFRARRRRWIHRIGRPTPVISLDGLTEKVWGANIWAKREDLCQGGSFCINTAVTQALVAQRMGKQRLVGETATGDFGVALGAVGAAMGMEVSVFMGRSAVDAEPINVARMEKMGVELISVDGDSRGRSQAIAEALRTYSVASETTMYATSSLASPSPYPQMLGEALGVVGRECRRQLGERDVEPEYLVAPVGSGAFAAGMFTGFLTDHPAQLVGVQAGGDDSDRDAASLVRGRPGVYLGTRSLVLQNEEGQIEAPHAAARGMVMPAAGPQHARWLQEGRVHYVTVDDAEARRAVKQLLRTEGIVASPETGYGLAYALKLAPTLRPEQHIVFGITGTGMRGVDDAADEADDEEAR